jgi:hypothetical protein
LTYAIRMKQARCAALGFWPGPIDGREGPRTRAAYAEAVASQRLKGLPFQHSSGITQIRGHWTGGGHKANATDMRSYHALFQGDGTIIYAAPPESYRPHTLNANTGAIGLSMCCMAGAVESPFNPGRFPMTVVQLHAMAHQMAVWCMFFDVPVSQWSVMTHAEVQITLGIRQRNKWDVTWIPGMERPGDPIMVGNKIRSIVRSKIASLAA